MFERRLPHCLLSPVAGDCARRDGAPPLYSPSLTHVLSHATPSINLYLDSAGSGSTCLARVLAEALQGRGGEGGGVPER